MYYVLHGCWFNIRYQGYCLINHLWYTFEEYFSNQVVNAICPFDEYFLDQVISL